MRIHSNTLTESLIVRAGQLAGVTFTRLTRHGSKSRTAAFDVILTGSSPMRQNRGDDYAATWDEWGSFLGHLFALDPNMVTPYYYSADHFHWATGGDFRWGVLPERHKRHRWEFTGDAMTGAYSTFGCECGAIRRMTTPDHWQQINAVQFT